VHQLARLALQQKHVASMELLGELHARGVPRHELYTRYLTPAARLLGEEWRQDRKDFTQVTLGTAFLQQLLREVSLLWNDRPQRAGQHHRILLLPVEGEQHTFGISVLGELFHDAGWDVCGGPRIGRDELSRLVAREHLDAVGFSISSERMVEPLARQVEQVRRHARSSALRVLVGGGLVWREPALFSGMDVDRISAEGGDVVELAQAAVRAARA
jgi:methanogenic corrinoid protein MtbC1